MSKKSVRFSRALDGCTAMPPLKHTTVATGFDIESSEVARWLCSQSAVMQYVFDAAREHGAIAYDGDSGTWRGVDR